MGTTPVVTHPYQPPTPYPQRVAWTKLSKLECRYMQFLDIMRRVYTDVPFLDALKKSPTYLKFLRELISKKGDTGDASVALIGKACSAIL